MESYQDAQTRETTQDVIVCELTDKKNGLTFAREYLKADFLAAAVDALFYARRQAGLTQEQVARKLGKKQEAIARWEADIDGKMSLRQYVEIALACDVVPLNIVLEPIASVCDYVIHNPQAPRTQDLYSAWMKNVSGPTLAQPTTVHALTTQATMNVVPNTALPTQELTCRNQPAVNLAEQSLLEQYWSRVCQVWGQWPDLGTPTIALCSQTSTVSQAQLGPAHAATFQDRVAA